MSLLNASMVAALRACIKADARDHVDGPVACPVCGTGVSGKNLVQHYDRQHRLALEAMAGIGSSEPISGIDRRRSIGILLVAFAAGLAALALLAALLIIADQTVRAGLALVIGAPVLLVMLGVFGMLHRFRTTVALQDEHLVVRRWPGTERRLQPPFQVAIGQLRWGGEGGLGPDHNHDTPIIQGLCLTIHAQNGSLQVASRGLGVGGFQRRWGHFALRRTRWWPTACRLSKQDMLRLESWLARSGALTSTVSIDRVRAYIAHAARAS